MLFKDFSLKWFLYVIVEDLHEACKTELHALEEKERNKGHCWCTPKENLPHGWRSWPMDSIGKGNGLTVFGPYQCIWESPEHKGIRRRYKAKIIHRYISGIPHIVGVLGGLLGIASFIMQLVRCNG